MYFIIAFACWGLIWGLLMHFLVWKDKIPIENQILVAATSGFLFAALKSINWRKFYKKFRRK